MAATIPFSGNPYETVRAIDRVLVGRGWRVVAMHAEGVIRIAPHGTSLFAPTTLVLEAGEQLIVSAGGGLQIQPIPTEAAT